MPMSSAERVARRRAAMRAAGLRPIQLWVPDTRSAAFLDECRRQSRLIAASETLDSLDEDAAWERAGAEAWGDEEG
jgi:hypothetical protein